MPQQATTNITQIGQIIIPASDKDRAIAFYVDVLGMELRADATFGEGHRWIEVGPVGGATTISFANPPGTDIVTSTGICVTLATADIDADHARLVAQGVDVDPEVLRPGAGAPPMVFFRDPDGNILMLVEQG